MNSGRVGDDAQPSPDNGMTGIMTKLGSPGSGRSSRGEEIDTDAFFPPANLYSTTNKEVETRAG